MDPALSAALLIGAVAALVGLLLYGAVLIYNKGYEASNAVATERLNNRDSTIASLRAQLAAESQANKDAQDAAGDLLDTSRRNDDVPPGPDGDRLLWGDGATNPTTGGSPTGQAEALPGPQV